MRAICAGVKVGNTCSPRSASVNGIPTIGSARLWSRRYGLQDGMSILVSWALLVTILIYIYPLKAIFGSMWFLLSDGRFGHALGRRTDAQARALFAIFAVGFTAIALEVVLLNLRAWQ